LRYNLPNKPRLLSKKEIQMDTSTAVIIVVALFALIVVGGFLVYRSRSQVTINTPLGSLDMQSSNDPPPQKAGVLVEAATSRGGGLLAEDKTGKGVELRRVDVQDDILASSQTPENPPDPKA
jgi:hypothetical protein